MNNEILLPLTDKSFDVLSGISTLLEWKDLEAVPWGSTLIKALTLGKSITDRIFLNKVFRFYSQCNDISYDKRVEFCQKYTDVKFGDNLLLLIESTDNFEKIEVLGKLFKSLLCDEITKEEFDQTCFSVKSLPITTMYRLPSIFSLLSENMDVYSSVEKKGLDIFDCQVLESIGFIRRQAVYGGEVIYNITVPFEICMKYGTVNN